MEFVQELVLTAVVGLLFSFLVAKLVSMVTGGGGNFGREDSVSKSVEDVSEEIIMEELLRRQQELKVEGFESEKRVELVEESVKEVDEKKVDVRAEEIVAECCHLRAEEKEVEEEALKNLVELPEKSEVVVEKEGEENISTNSAKESPEAVIEKEIEEELLENKVEKEIIVAKPEEEKITVVEEESETKRIEGVEEVIEGVVDEDDDWEGIERSELEKVFASAAKFVGSGSERAELATVGSDAQMELYALHKVATEGPCCEPQPMALMMSARAKWNAWQRLGSMLPEVAMERYIALLSEKVPRWKEDHSAGDSKLASAEAGISTSKDPDLSTLATQHPPFSNEQTPELKPNTEGGEVTAGSSVENKGKDDEHSSAS